MKQRFLWTSLCAAACIAGASRPAGATAQDAPPKRLSQQEAEHEDAQQEMLKLFGKVERRLKDIDKLLQDASAGDTKKLKEAGLSGMDQLLQRTAQSSREVQQDIDRLLELARQAGQQGGGGGGGGSSSNRQPNGQQGGQQQQQGGGEGSSSPLDGRSEQSTQREAVPELPQQGGTQQQRGQDQAGQQRQQQQQGSQPQSQQGGERPNDPRNAGGRQGNQQGSDPAADAKGAGSAQTDGADRWGDLPVHARDVFRTQGGRDLPPRYRDAIDGYYRRLNKRP